MSSNINTQESTLKFKDFFLYGLGGMFSYSFWDYFLSYTFLIFMTDIAGLPSLLAAAIYSAGSWIKLGTMAVSGVIIDGTNMKWGKYRSWILIGTIVICAVTGTMYIPFNVPTGFKAVIIVLCYGLAYGSYNIVWVAGRTIVGPMSKNNADSVGLTSAAWVGSSAGGAIYGWISAAVLGLFAFSKAQYALTAYLYSIIFLLGTIVMMRLTKKYDAPQEVVAKKEEKNAEKVSIIEMFKCLKGQSKIFFIATTIGNCQGGFFSALLAYFTTYVLKNPDALGLSITLYSVFSFLGGLCAPYICKLFTKKTGYALTQFITGLFYLGIYLFGSNATIFLICRAGMGFIGAFGGALLPAMCNDVADYNEMEGNSRARAFVQSLMGTSIRVGIVVASSTSSFGLAKIGYEKGMEMTDAMLRSITNLMVVVPTIACFLAVIGILFYKVDEHKLDEWRLKKAESND